MPNIEVIKMVLNICLQSLFHISSDTAITKTVNEKNRLKIIGERRRDYWYYSESDKNKLFVIFVGVVL